MASEEVTLVIDAKALAFAVGLCDGVSIPGPERKLLAAQFQTEAVKVLTEAGLIGKAE